MAIFDDEADDACIDASQNKLIPNVLRSLSGSFHGTTFIQHLCNLHAYTATPQANFLQYANNPLAPDDFVSR